jgi:hypothetical protein
MAVDSARTDAGPATAGGAGPATWAEDLVAVLLGACLVGGALADGWAHANLPSTLEGFFTPWHGLLYAGFAGTAAWTFFLAYRRRARAPYWWRDGWPRGYRIGALGVLIFLAGGLADMVWHETLGVEVGLNAVFSPSHMALDAGAALMLSSPLRSWWATRDGPRRAATGVASLTLAAMAVSLLLTHSSAFIRVAPVWPFEPALRPDGSAEALRAVAGVDAYLVTTVLLAAPLLWCLRRGPVLGVGTALVAGVLLFGMVMFEFPAPGWVAGVGALAGAAAADAVQARIDATRGPAAPGRLPLAGALFAGLVWAGHLAGLGIGDAVRWPVEMWTGIVVLCAVLGAVLGGLAARPAEQTTA